jgi:rhamnosyltransferase
MKVSVIIPTKNPGPIFHKVLSAVLNQATDFDYEVLVIDSGSTDGTVDYIGSLNNAILRLHCIEPSSFGHGRTRNMGIEMTSGQYAVLITHDAMPASENWLDALVSAADKDDSIAGVFGRHIAYPEASPFTKRELELHFSGFVADPVVCIEDPGRYARDQGYRQFLHFFSDNNALVRRSVWETLPYPDVDFAEDQIWAQKIVEAGFKKAYAHEAVVFHSHDYALGERLQRSFDESYAFYRLFGYVLCADLKSMLRSWVALNLRDISYVRSEGLQKFSLVDIIRMPFDNLMRLMGHYLGARGDRLSPRVRRLFSWDQRLMSGLRSSS